MSTPVPPTLEDRISRWRREHPRRFLLAASDPAGLAQWLRRARLLGADEPLGSVTKAGEGNMNCVLRVGTPRRSLIVKQARPWVEKYPQFNAPTDRARHETGFYRLVAAVPNLAALMPRLLHVDESAGACVLEDLGERGDYTDIYRGAEFPTVELERLAAWLSGLHRSFGAHPARPDLANGELLTMNSRHIFFIPVQADNGLDLDTITPGLATAAARLREDVPLTTRLGDLARLYLAKGEHLVHGDFFPGSLLRTPAGPRVIDPEFAHFGRPEFDAGVLLAHLRLAGQPAALATVFRCAYQPPPGFDPRLMRGFAGAEIIRRLIGYAQLPLTAGLARKTRLLKEARELVLNPDDATGAAAAGPNRNRARSF